jgi:BlaI family transcriptional regulator, penicillinase repressor
MKDRQHQLSRRERQIMDVIYKLGQATAADVQERLANPPSYSTVRAKLRVLEEKGFVKHQEQGPRYLYLSTVPRDTARRSALRHMVDTFFGGSPEQLVATLLDDSSARISEDELQRLSKLIDKARTEGL